MHLLLLLAIYVGIAVTMWRSRLNPLTIYLCIWTLVFANWILGPLEYSLATPIGLGVGLLTAYVLTFGIFYFVGRHFAVTLRHTASSQPLSSIQRIISLGSIGVFTLFAGRLITALPFLASLNFAGLRASFLTDVNLLTQAGAVLSGLFFIALTRIIFYDAKLFALEKIALGAFLLIPVLSAGRQQYLQMLLLFIVGLAFLGVRHASRVVPTPSPRARGKTIRTLLALAIAATLLSGAISVLRFDPASAEHFGSKLNMLSSYSGVELRSDYSGLVRALPIWLSDLFVEYSYYFGAQIPKFGEMFSFSEFSLFTGNVLDKFPVIDRNIGKILSVFGIYEAQLVETSFSGNIASFTWGTGLSGNLGALGLVGAFLVQASFAALAGYAHSLHRISPASFAAFNFSVANVVVSVYDTMFSVLSDTSFFVYYLTSLLLFFRSIRRR